MILLYWEHLIKDHLSVLNTAVDNHYVTSIAKLIKFVNSERYVKYELYISCDVLKEIGINFLYKDKQFKFDSIGQAINHTNSYFRKFCPNARILSDEEYAKYSLLK